MTYIIHATGQAAQLLEIVPGGYYFHIFGHARFIPTDAAQLIAA